MQDVKATGYDSLCQTGVEEDSRLFWRSYRTFQGLKTNPFLSPDKNETAGSWFRNSLRICPKRLREDTRRDSAARWTKPTTKLDPIGMAPRQTSVKEWDRTYVLHNVIAPGGRRSFNRSYACCYIWIDGGINDHDASVCASVFAARSAPPPHPRDAGFLLELIPASSSPADSRAPAAPWCSSPAA